MADYFIDPDNGSDSNGGTAWDDAWKTLNHAIDSSPAVTLPASGLTRIILRGGSLHRGGVRLYLDPTADAPLEILGDRDGSLFAASGDPNPRKGACTITGWDDPWTSQDLPSITIHANSKSQVTLRGLRIVGKAKQYSCVGGGRLENWTIEDCEFAFPILRTGVAIWSNHTKTDTPINLKIRRCFFASSGGNDYAIQVTANSAAADWDTGVEIESCLIVGGNRGVSVVVGGSDPGVPTGLRVQNCTITGASTAVFASGSVVGAAPSVEVYGSYLNGGLSASNTSQIVENGNQIIHHSPRSNVLAGPDSVVQGGIGTDGIEPPFGFTFPGRPPYEPAPDSSLLGWGEYGSTPALDLYGRPFDPIAPACGAVERVDPVEPGPAVRPHYLIV